MFLLLIIGCFSSVAANFELSEGEPCMSGDVQGTCRDIRYCPTALLIDIKLKERPPICSFVDEQPIVCCTDCDIMDATKIVVTVNGIEHKLGTNKSYDNCLEYISNLPYSCKAGVRTGIMKVFEPKRRCHRLHINKQYSLIGTLAKRGEFPHMALLGYGEDVESAQWACGGSIISERYVLTAAHCSHHPLGEVSYVAVGILRRSDPAELWQRLRVHTFTPHPEYKAPSKYNDIALIQTATDIKFSETVLPICLADRELAAAEAQAEGWGAEGHNQQSSDGLRKAWLERFSDAECDSLYPVHRHQVRGVDRATQVCYGDHKDNKDTCQGDSGGPLQAWGGRTCVQFVVGVTSYGRACGERGGAGVYTRVLPYLPWIESHVWP